MTSNFRNYSGITGYTEDFYTLSEFLFRINRDNIRPGMLDWVFLEWQTARDVYKAEELGKIGLWYDNGQLVAATPYEDHINAFSLCTDEEHRHLRPEMLDYTCDNMAHDGLVTVLIDDSDIELQQLAFLKGFRPTQNRAQNARLDISEETTRYSLPEGFRVIGFDEGFDVRKYNRVLWYGFEHGPAAPTEDDEMLQFRINCVSSPYSNRHLMTAVVAPDGEFVSHCGMWYRDGDNSIVEPVATNPNYRKMGLGRAAVLEAVKRCGTLGAKRAYVSSSQQFYYNIGFYPVVCETFWQRKV
jgi:GNAT superfamily N-acetyltransferase